MEEGCGGGSKCSSQFVFCIFLTVTLFIFWAIPHSAVINADKMFLRPCKVVADWKTCSRSIMIYTLGGSKKEQVVAG